MIDFIQYVKRGREGRERKEDLFGVPLLFFFVFLFFSRELQKKYIHCRSFNVFAEDVVSE